MAGRSAARPPIPSTHVAALPRSLRARLRARKPHHSPSCRSPAGRARSQQPSAYPRPMAHDSALKKSHRVGLGRLRVRPASWPDPRSRKTIPPRSATRSDPRDRTSPDPHLVVVGWNSEPDPYGPRGPGNRLGLHQLFDTVLPQHPGLHPLRDRRGADRQLPHLLWQQAPWLALGEAGTFDHAPEYRTGVLVPASAWMTALRLDS